MSDSIGERSKPVSLLREDRHAKVYCSPWTGVGSSYCAVTRSGSDDRRSTSYARTDNNIPGGRLRREQVPYEQWDMDGSLSTKGTLLRSEDDN